MIDTDPCGAAAQSLDAICATPAHKRHGTADTTIAPPSPTALCSGNTIAVSRASPTPNTVTVRERSFFFPGAGEGGGTQKSSAWSTRSGGRQRALAAASSSRTAGRHRLPVECSKTRGTLSDYVIDIARKPHECSINKITRTALGPGAGGFLVTRTLRFRELSQSATADVVRGGSDPTAVTLSRGEC